MATRSDHPTTVYTRTHTTIEAASPTPKNNLISKTLR